MCEAEAQFACIHSKRFTVLCGGTFFNAYQCCAFEFKVCLSLKVPTVANLTFRMCGAYRHKCWHKSAHFVFKKSGCVQDWHFLFLYILKKEKKIHCLYD